MSTIGERITDLIVIDYSSIPAYSKADLINAAINEVADKYNDIFKLNEEEFTSTYWQNNRNRLREFNKNAE